MRDFSNDLSSLALNTATLGHNLDGYGAGWSTEQVIDACAERGFGGIVFWRRELANNAISIGERVRASGMQVVGLCRAPFLVGPLVDAGGARAVHDELLRAIDLAAALQAPVLTIVAGGVEPGSKGIVESLSVLADRVAAAVPHATDCKVKLALEPLHPVYAGDRSCLVTLRDALDICDRIDSTQVGVAIDVYHVWWDTTLQAQLERAGSSRILGYHLCDWLANTSDILLDRGMMGDGVAHLVNLRQWVEDAGYSGFCEIEIFSANNWWQRSPNEVLDQCVERFKSVC